MNKRALATLVVLVVVIALAVVACGDKVPTGAIAAVGDGVVTQGQFDEIIDQAKAQSKQSNQAFPKVGSYDYNQYAARVIEFLVSQELLNQVAAEPERLNQTLVEVLGRDLKPKETLTKPLKVTDKEVAERIAQIEEAYGGKDKVDEILKQTNMTRKDLDKLMRNEILSQKVYDQVSKSATVADKAVRTYYNDNIAQYEQPETRTLRHILVKTKAEADAVRALLVADPSAANWKKVAKKSSIDPGSKDKGGLYTGVKPGDMVPNFDKMAFQLKKNVISEPVKTQFGYHVIMVTKITGAKTETYAEVKDEIKAQLAGTKVQNLWNKWLKRLTADAEVIYADGYDPTELKKTKPEPSPSASEVGTPVPSASPSPSETATPSPSPSE